MCVLSFLWCSCASYLRYIVSSSVTVLASYENRNPLLNTGIPHFIALHGYCVFHKLKIYGNPTASKSVGSIFPNSICSLCVSVSHFGSSLNISSFFIIIIILLWWSVISDFFMLLLQKDYSSLKAQMMVGIFLA